MLLVMKIKPCLVPNWKRVINPARFELGTYESFWVFFQIKEWLLDGRNANTDGSSSAVHHVPGCGVLVSIRALAEPVGGSVRPRNSPIKPIIKGNLDLRPLYGRQVIGVTVQFVSRCLSFIVLMFSIIYTKCKTA